MKQLISVLSQNMYLFCCQSFSVKNQNRVPDDMVILYWKLRELGLLNMISSCSAPGYRLLVSCFKVFMPLLFYLGGSSRKAHSLYRAGMLSYLY